ncbi:hypothetical protein KFE80_00760 [bacterium SCSIO 12696]|nr:hypothetical protein KFE80_00760 [bacterium SCSIO 12696]
MNRTICSFSGMLFIACVAFLSALWPNQANAQAQRDDSLKYACLAQKELIGTDVDENWCQCRNDYFAGLLTDQDWVKYTQDYFALTTREASQRSTKPYSYDRYITLANSHCRTCKAKDFKGCISDDGRTPSHKAYTRILNDIGDGIFNSVPRDLLYEKFFMDYLAGYSAFCRHNLRSDYTVRTTVWEEWTRSGFFEYKSDGGVYQLFIHNRFLDSFDRYTANRSRQESLDFITGLLNDLKRQDINFPSMQDYLKSTVDSLVFMKGHLQNRCDAPDVQRAYQNLHRFEKGQAPLVAPGAVAARQQRQQLEQVKRKSIEDATQKSYELAKINWEKEKARRAALPKKQIACDAQLEKATTLWHGRGSQDGMKLNDMNGVWRGSINGTAAELALWSRRPGPYGTGFIFFPEKNCLMQAGFSPRKVGRSVNSRRSVGNFTLTAYSPKWRPNNCASLVLEDRDREIHFFSGGGVTSHAANTREFVWYPSNLKLSRLTPQSCGGLEVTFKPAKLSPAFARELKKYKQPGRYGEKASPQFISRHSR